MLIREPNDAQASASNFALIIPCVKANEKPMETIGLKRFQMYEIDANGHRAATLTINALALALYPKMRRGAK
jgi:hypothetical protein